MSSAKAGHAAYAFPDPPRDIPLGSDGGLQTAVLAGGCFWCTEAVYAELAGVREVTSGYVGDVAAKADYETVCSGTTKHAEAIRIVFHPSVISYGQLLKVFFSVAHDPTQLDRQGNDLGHQYRSAIFYADDDQKATASAYIDALQMARVFPAPIVTRLEPLSEFFEAEAYHQNYAARNPRQPYIATIALPKIAKLHKHYREKLKSGG
jgi:peptide-methionine (S)-S-oxide reductase